MIGLPALSCSITRSRSASKARASASIAFKASMSSGSGVVSDMRGSLRTSRAVYNIDGGVRVREGCFQLMPSRSIDSWACVRWILPLSGSGQTKCPLQELLGALHRKAANAHAAFANLDLDFTP
jgi:hypothetical protein